MNQQTQNKERAGTQTKEKSCGSGAAGKPLSEQMKGRSPAAKEEGCCSSDKGHDHGDDNKTKIETISKDQLLEKINSNSGVQVVNVLSPELYGKGFIKGSKKIPLEQLNSRMSELDKTKEVVTYCASSECPASMKAAEKLEAKGFKVKAYEGGIKEWSEAGLPTDK